MLHEFAGCQKWHPANQMCNERAQVYVTSPDVVCISAHVVMMSSVMNFVYCSTFESCLNAFMLNDNKRSMLPNNVMVLLRIRDKNICFLVQIRPHKEQNGHHPHPTRPKWPDPNFLFFFKIKT